jgi:plastocyanin
MPNWTRTVALPATLAAVLAVASAGPAAAQEITAEPAGKVAPQSLLIKLKPWTLGFEEAEVEAGLISFRIENPSTSPHGFRIQGPGTGWRTDGLILPQEARTIAVELEPGTYTLTCPVEGHADKGMTATLTVTE